MKTTTRFLLWAARIVSALILLQTLFFKFSASAESVYIFETVGMEPWGRIGTGIGELLASLLLFIPGFVGVGALMAIGLMSGALFFHFTLLGVEVMGDGGLLMAYAFIVWLCCIFILYHFRSDVLRFFRR